MNRITLTKEQMANYLAVVDENERYRQLSLTQKEAMIRRWMTATFLDLRCDWAFKRVMQDPELLMLLLNDFLPETITEVQYLHNEPSLIDRDEKQVIMDVICTVNNGRRFIVEMQQFKKSDFRARMFYYGASLVRSQLKSGDKYDSLKPVYVICFMDFKLRHPDDKLVYRYWMEELESHEPYGKWLSIYLCELPRLQKSAMAEMNNVESWFHILRESVTFAGIPEDMDSRFAKVLLASMMNTVPENEKLEYLRAMTEDEERLEYGRDRYEDGLSEGMEKGIKEGIEKKARATALTMLSDGVSIVQIARWTGLPEDEIQQLSASV